MKRINLSTAYQTKRVGEKRFSRIHWGMASCSSLLLLLIGAGLIRTFRFHNEIRLLQQQVAPIEEQVSELERLKARVELINGYRDSTLVSSLLAAFTRLIPDEAVLRSISIDSAAGPVVDKSIDKGHWTTTSARTLKTQIEGMAAADSVLAQLMKRLNDNRAFRNIVLLDSRPSSVNGHNCIHFKILVEAPINANTSLALSNELNQQ